MSFGRNEKGRDSARREADALLLEVKERQPKSRDEVGSNELRHLVERILGVHLFGGEVVELQTKTTNGDEERISD